MALISHSGSLSQTLSQNNHKLNVNRMLVPEKDIPMTGDNVISQVTPVRNTFVNKTAINPERYPDKLGSLLGYATGSPIQVTYYSTYRESVNERSHTTDTSRSRNEVHTDYIKILNFEIRLISPMSTQFNSEGNFSEMTGEAICYSNFEPFHGDIFLYEINDGIIGEFRVTNSEPTNLFHGTQYKINFDLISYLDSERLSQLDTGVTNTVYFDKQKFLHTEGVLLTHDSYVNLNKIKLLKENLIKFYDRTFYDENLSSYVRPDGLYDPYIVKYLLQKISISQILRRPLLLISHLPEFEDSIWGMLLDETRIKRLDDVVYLNYIVRKHTVGMYRTDMNSLVNRYYIQLSDTTIDIEEGEENPYYSYAFNLSMYRNTENTSIVEKEIREAISSDKYDIPRIIDMMSNYRNLSKENQFYYIPLYLSIIETTIKLI